MFRFMLVCLGISVILGCAAPFTMSTLDYKKPEPNKVLHTATVETVGSVFFIRRISLW